MRNIIFILAAFFFVFILSHLLIAAVIGFSMFSFLSKMGGIHVRAYDDKFQVTVLDLKSGPDYFMERVWVKCERDMDASIWVTDLKAAGIGETRPQDGKIVYIEGNPHKIGGSASVQANGDFSTCDILFG